MQNGDCRFCRFPDLRYQFGLQQKPTFGYPLRLRAALSSVVSGCTFTCEDTAMAFCSDKDGGYATAGLRTSANGWTINANQFRHLYYGVRSENSSITLQACAFRHMRRHAYAYGNARAASYLGKRWFWNLLVKPIRQPGLPPQYKGQ